VGDRIQDPTSISENSDRIQFDFHISGPCSRRPHESRDGPHQRRSIGRRHATNSSKESAHASAFEQRIDLLFRCGKQSDGNVGYHLGENATDPDGQHPTHRTRSDSNKHLHPSGNELLNVYLAAEGGTSRVGISCTLCIYIDDHSTGI
jgi:hypothetical protein